MKKKPVPSRRPARSPAAAAADPSCDGSPTHPPNPPPSSEIPGAEVLNFVYHGAHDLAKAYNDAEYVQHTMILEDGGLNYVFSLRHGPHKRRTLGKLNIRALLGPCTVVIQGGASRTLQAGEAIDIPAGSTFSFAAPGAAVLFGISLAGPGLIYPGSNPKDP